LFCTKTGIEIEKIEKILIDIEGERSASCVIIPEESSSSSSSSSSRSAPATEWSESVSGPVVKRHYRRDVERSATHYTRNNEHHTAVHSDHEKSYHHVEHDAEHHRAHHVDEYSISSSDTHHHRSG